MGVITLNDFPWGWLIGGKTPVWGNLKSHGKTRGSDHIFNLTRMLSLKGFIIIWQVKLFVLKEKYLVFISQLDVLLKTQTCRDEFYSTLHTYIILGPRLAAAAPSSNT